MWASCIVEEEPLAFGDPRSLFGLASIRRKDLTETETYIVKMLETSMLYEPTSDLADELAQYIDAACPPLEEEEEAESYLLNVFDIILTVASSADITEDIQERLVSGMAYLKLCAKGEIGPPGVRLTLSNLEAAFLIVP